MSDEFEDFMDDLANELSNEHLLTLGNDLSNEHLLAEEWEEWNQSLEHKECIN